MSGQIRATQGPRLAGGVLLAAAAAGAVAAALGSAGTANATCASISGISAGSSGGSACTSTVGSFSLGIGDRTFANSDGFLTGAVAIGNNNTAADATVANSQGFGTLAIAVGKNVDADAFGTLSVAVAQGQGDSINNRLLAQAGTQSDGGLLNAAINVGGKAVGTNNIVFSGGTANLSANVGGSSTATRPLIVQSWGTGNAAFNLGGNGSIVSAGNLLFAGTNNETGIPGPTVTNPDGTKSTLGLAFNGFGSNNTVSSVGPLGIAGALGVNNLNGVNRVLQSGPGININNL